jgi:hypothetical protein
VLAAVVLLAVAERAGIGRGHEPRRLQHR